jgi:hypothetical protein
MWDDAWIMNWKDRGIKWSWLNLRNYPGVWLEELVKTKNFSVRTEIRIYVLPNMTKQVFIRSSTTSNFPLLISEVIFDNYLFYIYIKVIPLTYCMPAQFWSYLIGTKLIENLWQTVWLKISQEEVISFWTDLSAK